MYVCVCVCVCVWYSHTYNYTVTHPPPRENGFSMMKPILLSPNQARVMLNPNWSFLLCRNHLKVESSTCLSPSLTLPPQPIRLRKKVGQVKSNCHGWGPLCEVSSSWGTPVAFNFEGRGPRSIQSSTFCVEPAVDLGFGRCRSMSDSVRGHEFGAIPALLNLAASVFQSDGFSAGLSAGLSASSVGFTCSAASPSGAAPSKSF